MVFRVLLCMLDVSALDNNPLFYTTPANKEHHEAPDLDATLALLLLVLGLAAQLFHVGTTLSRVTLYKLGLGPVSNVVKGGLRRKPPNHKHAPHLPARIESVGSIPREAFAAQLRLPREVGDEMEAQEGRVVVQLEQGFLRGGHVPSGTTQRETQRRSDDEGQSRSAPDSAPDHRGREAKDGGR